VDKYRVGETLAQPNGIKVEDWSNFGMVKLTLVFDTPYEAAVFCETLNDMFKRRETLVITPIEGST